MLNFSLTVSPPEKLLVQQEEGDGGPCLSVDGDAELIGVAGGDADVAWI